MSLQWRIWGAFLFVVALTVALSVGVAYWAASQQLDDLRAQLSSDEAEQAAYYLSQVYTKSGGWDDLESALYERYLYDPQRLKELYGYWTEEAILDDSFFYEEPFRVVVMDDDGAILLDSYEEYSAGDFPDGLVGYENEIVDLRDGEVVGSVMVDIERDMLRAEFDLFLDDILFTTILGGLLTSGMVLLLGVWFANRITAPVTALTAAMQGLAAKGSTDLLPVTSSDELGQMSQAFNQMAQALQTQQDLRKRLIDDVSHELNTPLSVIQLEANGLKDGMQSPDEAAGNIIQEVTLLYNLVNDLTWLGETDAGQVRLDLAEQDMASLLSTEVERWQIQAQAQGIDLTLASTDGLPPVRLDSLRMAQVLGNLLGNALQHTHLHHPDGGGRVTVSAGLRPIPNQAGEWVVIAVMDNSQGIPAEDLPHIFERFYRSDLDRSRRSGRGLGLAIARQLVRLHGGHIWAESSFGHGSSFYVAFPPAES